MKENSLFKIVRAVIARFLMYLFSLFPIDKNKIVFSSFNGLNCSDSPRVISDAIVKSYKDVDVVWLLKKVDAKSFGTRVVKHDSIRAIYELATARVWVDSHRKPIWVKKRKKQYYIQTWHGGIALKKVEAAVVEVDNWPKSYIVRSQKDSQMADLFVSGCEWRTQDFRKNFWYNGEILKSGQPKADIFYKDNIELVNAVKQSYGIDTEAQIILYAPTFRKNKSTDCYNIDYKALLNSIEGRFGGKWYIFVRLHPAVSNLKMDVCDSNRIINVTDYPEMNELIVTSDVLITDYSSCLFDGFLARKIVFIYASDLENYETKERGLNFDIRNLPAPLATNTVGLEEQIREFDLEEYEKQRLDFVQKLGYYGDGKATKKVVDIIMEKITKARM